ncbi:hypothetical protein GGI25_004627 [Coemansia spiralis]|uniref:Complex 1 LYR protein domain-containing protein n=2 Tax=Coemansia TaxID=4863 RepID=A0A9W8G6A7_9FUNG|nr:hypothetical protein BX070DRAFT_232790 [Coemansia spiralis]KAJ1989663.1 hypothetical protein EDC05_004552 [Coemansia umbellata]KAJ2620426.1 hypothetical protein GGI26_004996 [Coemansia sp. RSA 1358]KAJ2673642.1 hypothetical protein GGI25_004627 [Coemansia spiralis]
MKSEGIRWCMLLYRDLLRAAPRAISGNRQHAKILMQKIRQGFDENKNVQSEVEKEELCRRGNKTLGLLKLARELGSIERMLVDAIVNIYKKRQSAAVKPPVYRRRMQPLSSQTYEKTYVEYDKVISKIEQDLDVILPQDKCARSLNWIPSLKNLYKNDAALKK